MSYGNSRRRHGWQLPLHPLQIVGMSVFSLLVAAFYCFLGLFLGNRVAEVTVTAIFSFLVVCVVFLFIRCTAIDPTDKTRFVNNKKKRRKPKDSIGFSQINYGFILSQIVVRFLRRLERKILRTCIRRKYLDPLNTSLQLEPLLPFPLVIKDDSISPQPKEDDLSFCTLCDFEVKKNSKHCRICNRCVEGFDHHCRWLNNCVGKKNYSTFILLLTFVLMMLIVEGGTALAIFIRCFTDRNGIEHELKRRLYVNFPRGVLAAISVVLVLMTAYSSAALGQLFFFHVVLIRKGMRTYDYILAMKEVNRSMELEGLEDSDSSSDSDFSSDESIGSDSPKRSAFISRFICNEGRTDQNQQKISIRIDGEPESSASNKKQVFRASIDPWKLINLSREKALLAADKARERLVKQKSVRELVPLKPLPLETKNRHLMNIDTEIASSRPVLTPRISKGGLPGSPGQFSSPRRRFSCSPTVVRPDTIPSPKRMYRSNFDLKLTQVSRELETYISRQVLCSVLGKDGSEASPQ